MTTEQHFGDWSFEDDLVFAMSSAGEKVKFSRHERALLRFFISRPGVLLSRAQLLERLEGSREQLDRNIDFLLSRLRRKLGDSAKSPKYIATQYGEGYIWIAKPGRPSPRTDQLYLSVGPVYGLDYAPVIAGDAEEFVNTLVESLSRRLDRQGEVARIPERGGDNAALHRHEHARYRLELSIFSRDRHSFCSLVLISRTSGQVFGSYRQALFEPAAGPCAERGLEDLCANICEDLWRARIFRAEERPSLTADPLSVGLYKASQLFEPEMGNLSEVEQRLRAVLHEQPDHHQAAILLATNLQVQRLAGRLDIADISEQRSALEQEIEQLVTQHLQGVHDNALFLAAAAERLHDLGHAELAESMANRALDLGPSVAACYMVMGRIKVHQGFIEEGISYYEHSLEMSEKDSVFHMMLQTMRCIAYRAVNDQARVRELAPYIIDRESDATKKAALTLYFFAGDPAFFGEQVAQRLSQLSGEFATRLLTIVYVVAAKPFWQAEHRENIMRGAVQFIVREYGEEAIPEALWQRVPALLQELPEPRQLPA